MKRTCLAVILVAFVAIFFVASEASAMYNPATGTFLSRDPGRVGGADMAMANHFVPRDQYADGMNLFQYVRSHPTYYVDLMGAEATCPAPSLSDGERWWDSDNHDIGIIWQPLGWVENQRWANCLGNACGFNKALIWNYDKSYVPKGCEEKPCKEMTASSTPCKKCNVELVVAWYHDEKDNQDSFHAVGRDPTQVPCGWHTRDGDGSGMVYGGTGTGQFIRDIRDYNAHFERYFKLMSPDQKSLVVSTRCFCCKKDEMSLHESGRLQGKQ